MPCSAAFTRQLERSRVHRRPPLVTHEQPPSRRPATTQHSVHTAATLSLIGVGVVLFYGLYRYRSKLRGCFTCAATARASTPPPQMLASPPPVTFDIGFVNNEIEVSPWDNEIEGLELEGLELEREL